MAPLSTLTNCEFAIDRQTRSATLRPYTRPQVWQYTVRSPEACCGSHFAIARWPSQGHDIGRSSGLRKIPIVLAMTALSWEPGDGPSLIVAPLPCCSQWMAEIDAFFDAVRLADKYQRRASVIVMQSVRHAHKPTVCLLKNHFPRSTCGSTGSQSPLIHIILRS